MSQTVAVAGLPEKPQQERKTVDALLCGHNARASITNERYFSATSTADVFEVRGGVGSWRPELHDEEISAILVDEKASAAHGKAAVDFRIFFIDEVPQDTDRIQFRSTLFAELVAVYGVSPRFAGFLPRQHMPGRSVYVDEKTGGVLGNQFWYSAVLRYQTSSSPSPTNGGPNLNPNKRILGWSRFCVWTLVSHPSPNTTTTTLLILRCPSEWKTKFVECFCGGEGVRLLRDRMLVHAWMAEQVLLKTYDFLEVFSGPIYEWELKTLETAEDYTNRTQAFLMLRRQITQAATDYDILDKTLEHLKKEHAWLLSQSGSLPPWSHPDTRLSADIFDTLLSESSLVRTYSSLYEERTNIGMNEGFAMVNQRDAELNLQMASESTEIARASHKDGQSLRIISILSMLFLPASLVSGVFGMGFFSTSPDPSGAGKPVWSVAGQWWIYVVVAGVMTVLTVGGMGVWVGLMKWKGKRRGPIRRPLIFRGQSVNGAAGGVGEDLEKGESGDGIKSE